MKKEDSMSTWKEGGGRIGLISASLRRHGVGPELIECSVC